MCDIIFSISNKFYIPTFVTQATLLVIVFVAYAILSPGRMDITGLIIYGIISLIVMIITALMHGKRYFKKPSDW